MMPTIIINQKLFQKITLQMKKGELTKEYSMNECTFNIFY